MLVSGKIYARKSKLFSNGADCAVLKQAELGLAMAELIPAGGDP